MNNYELLNTLSHVYTSSSNKNQAIIFGSIACLSLGGLIYFMYKHKEVVKDLEYFKAKHLTYLKENSILMQSLQRQINDLNLAKNKCDVQLENNALV